MRRGEGATAEVAPQNWKRGHSETHSGRVHEVGRVEKGSGTRRVG